MIHFIELYRPYKRQTSRRKEFNEAAHWLQNTGGAAKVNIWICIRESVTQPFPRTVLTLALLIVQCRALFS